MSKRKVEFYYVIDDAVHRWCFRPHLPRKRDSRRHSHQRILVSLGDVKSQQYAAEWLEKLDEGGAFIENFENEGMQKVIGALKVAWQRPTFKLHS